MNDIFASISTEATKEQVRGIANATISTVKEHIPSQEQLRAASDATASAVKAYIPSKEQLHAAKDVAISTAKEYAPSKEQLYAAKDITISAVKERLPSKEQVSAAKDATLSALKDRVPSKEQLYSAASQAKASVDSVKGTAIEASKQLQKAVEEHPTVGLTVIKTKEMYQWTDNWLQQHPVTNQIVRGVIMGVGFHLAISSVLPMVGFTKEGVRLASGASKIQSIFYKGYTSGLFSRAQSLGAKGVPYAWGLIAGGIASSRYLCYQAVQSTNNNQAHKAPTM